MLNDVLDPSTRPGVRLARSVYERILDHIEAIDFDVLHDRVRVPAWQLGGAAMAAVPTPEWRWRRRSYS